MEEIAGGDGVGRVRLELGRGLPGGLRSVLAGPEAGDPEVQLHRGALRVQAGQLGEAGNGAVGPAAERLPDPRLERVVPGEERRSFRATSGLVQAHALAQVECLPIDSDPEVERERRRARTNRRLGGNRRRWVVARHGSDARDRRSRDEGNSGHDEADAGTRAHDETVAGNA